MATLNKDGQTIGRKGAQSRARLLQSGRTLLDRVPVQKITASGIARDAGLASQTFYLYFKDVDELLLQLCKEAAEDSQALLAELDKPWTQTHLMTRAESFIAAFYHYWDRHRAVLNVRNFLADSGHPRFLEERNTASLPIVQKIAAQIVAAHDGSLSDMDALARAIIFFSAIERMAGRYAELESTPARVDSIGLKRAEAHILSLLLTRVSVDP